MSSVNLVDQGSVKSKETVVTYLVPYYFHKSKISHLAATHSFWKWRVTYLAGDSDLLGALRHFGWLRWSLSGKLPSLLAMCEFDKRPGLFSLVWCASAATAGPHPGNFFRTLGRTILPTGLCARTSPVCVPNKCLGIGGAFAHIGS